MRLTFPSLYFTQLHDERTSVIHWRTGSPTVPTITTLLLLPRILAAIPSALTLPWLRLAKGSVLPEGVNLEVLFGSVLVMWICLSQVSGSKQILE